MIRVLTTILITICSLWPARMNAQTYKNFRQIPTDADASMIVNIIQDSYGMVWVGTNNGLYSYDGYTMYAHNKGPKYVKTHIYCSLNMDGGRLFLGTDNGLLIYNYRTDSYEPVPIRFPRDIRAMAKDGNTLWIGSFEGLFAYNLKSNKLKHYDARQYRGLSHNTIYSIIKGANGNIYIGTYNGLCFYNSRRHCFTRIALPLSARKSNVFVNSLLEDRISCCIWIGTEGNLYKLSLSSGKVDNITEFHDNSIKVLSMDSHHRLLVGTDNGLFIYDGRHIIQHVLHDSRNASSLSNDVVWSILHDSNGNVWLGTDDGLSMTPRIQDLQFTPISQITGQGAGNHFYCIYRDINGLLWLGGSNGLISSAANLSSPQTSHWYRVDNTAYPITHNRIRQIYEDREHHLWICTDGGLHRYQNGQWHRYNLEDRTRTRNANWAYNMYEDERGRLWVATCLGGILVVDKHKLEHSRDYCIADYSFDTSRGLAGMFVNQLVPDNKGNIWVLFYNHGLQRINMKTMRVENVGLSTYREDRNPSYLLSDSEHHLWIGIKGGILYIGNGNAQPRTVIFKNFSQSYILAIAEVKNEIWACTADGVWVIDKRQLTARRVYSTSHTFSCMYYDRRSNLIYMGSVDGLLYTTPENLKRTISRHSLQLTAVFANNELRFGQDGKAFRFFDDIEFAADENHLVFEFSDFPYAQTEKDNFIYQLDGVDKTWNTLPHNSNHITFNNLPSGNYKLLISRLDANGDPSSPLVVPFKILPHWYHSWWAQIIYTLLILTLVIWLIQFYRMRNRLKMERLEKERIMEQSRQKIEFFTNISHDFKTPLSMIIAPLSRLLQEIKDTTARPQLELAQRNAMKLTAMIHQLIDFDRVDNNINSTLMTGRVDFVELARKVFLGFEEGIFHEKGIKTVFQTNKETSFQQIDELKIESAISNLLSNAAKYTPQGGTVSMTISIDDQQLRLSIQDSGIGIPAKDLPYVSQRFFQSSATKGKREGTGIGLYMVRAYIELHGGTMDITSEEGKGTLVILTIPTKENAIPMPKTPELPADSESLPVVVLVDDNADVITFMTSILKPYFRCLPATNGKEGLKRCMEESPSLVITDMMMPEMDGMEMCQQLRRHVPTSTIPIIMLTAKNDKDTELESIKMSIDVFLAKPFDANILLLRAQQLVKKNLQIEKKERIQTISEPKAIEAVSEDEKFLLQITSLIEDHVGDFELNVNSLCEQMGLGNKLVYRKLKQLTGQTPVEYIKNIRMKKAAMLLSQQKFTVAEVMYMVGYSNTSYFSKCFQTEFGVTPRQYSESK
jgi:signal transduction histidine kinase/ligand-binding sensor domain-containing protein/CheY-like chemotaxis protein/AraC-like DNA-binding protein